MNDKTRTGKVKKTVLGSILVAGMAVGIVSYLLRPAQTAMQVIADRTKADARPAPEGTLAAGIASSQTGSTETNGAVSTALAVAGTASAATSSALPSNAIQVNYGMTDGTYDGRREYAFYGYVRVEAVVQNGQLQRVRVLEHPNDNGTSRYINSIAMPYLVQEAVQAQSANISLISGATLSSEAFVKSLNTALSQAGA